MEPYFKKMTKQQIIISCIVAIALLLAFFAGYYIRSKHARYTTLFSDRFFIQLLDNEKGEVIVIRSLGEPELYNRIKL